ncbi:MAG: hypothetical protein ABEK50_11725 [bacterium]
MLQIVNVDPLVCPDCGAEMIIVEVAEKQSDIQRILQDLDGYSSGTDPPRGPPEDSSSKYEPFQDDLPWEEIDQS